MVYLKFSDTSSGAEAETPENSTTYPEILGAEFGRSFHRPFPEFQFVTA
jgi:hypothetical protein